MLVGALDVTFPHGIVVDVQKQVRFYFYGFGSPAAVGRA
jgi:hypothetical protein